MIPGGSSFLNLRFFMMSHPAFITYIRFLVLVHPDNFGLPAGKAGSILRAMYPLLLDNIAREPVNRYAQGIIHDVVHSLSDLYFLFCQGGYPHCLVIHGCLSGCAA